MREFVGLLGISLTIQGGYEIVMIATRGATLGKLAVGIRVRMADREARPPWASSALRYLPFNLPQLVLTFLWVLLDLLWPLWDPRRQTLHDKAAGTVVVRTQG